MSTRYEPGEVSVYLHTIIEFYFSVLTILPLTFFLGLVTWVSKQYKREPRSTELWAFLRSQIVRGLQFTLFTATCLLALDTPLKQNSMVLEEIDRKYLLQSIIIITCILYIFGFFIAFVSNYQKEKKFKYYLTEGAKEALSILWVPIPLFLLVAFLSSLRFISGIEVDIVLPLLLSLFGLILAPYAIMLPYILIEKFTEKENNKDKSFIFELFQVHIICSTLLMMPIIFEFFFQILSEQ